MNMDGMKKLEQKYTFQLYLVAVCITECTKSTGIL